MEKGIHIIADLYKCDFNFYINKNNTEKIILDIKNIIQENFLTVVGEKYFEFAKNSFTLAFLLAESHLTIHTWPEENYISFEIARLKKCLVTGLDINENMIKQSKINNDGEIIKGLVDFVQGDGTSLNFKDNTFDLVTSGGSTIFMNDIYKGLSEYKRVCKDWGFIGDINFFYTDKIPTDTINEINNLLGINIEPWGKDYFLDLYEKVGLEKYYIFTDETYKPTLNELEEYCNSIIENSIYANMGNDIKKIAYKKFHNYMSLFYENNKYLSYGVFIYRKRPEKYKEQITLFGY